MAKEFETLFIPVQKLLDYTLAHAGYVCASPLVRVEDRQIGCLQSNLYVIVPNFELASPKLVLHSERAWLECLIALIPF